MNEPPTEEQLRQAYEEQLNRLTVPDVLVQTAVTLINLGAKKLGEDGDVDQAKTAIDATRALLPLLPEEVHSPLKDALSQLQMAFVRETQGAGEAAANTDATADDEARAPDEDERAKARSKLWTPPGT
jgi:hypothetical protein